MSLLSRIGRFFGLAEAPPMPMGDLAAFECWMDGAGSTAATRADLAVRIATVHTCVKVLAESVASLPCKLYRKVGDRREVAADHPLNDFVGWRPGARLTPFDLFEYGVTSMAFTGISAHQKVVDGTGRLLDLANRAGRVWVRRADAETAAGVLRRDRMSNYPMPGDPLGPQSWRNDGHDLASVIGHVSAGVGMLAVVPAVRPAATITTSSIVVLQLHDEIHDGLLS